MTATYLDKVKKAFSLGFQSDNQENTDVQLVGEMYDACKNEKCNKRLIDLSSLANVTRIFFISLLLISGVARICCDEGAKLESRSWGTHGELYGRVQQLLDD